MKKIVIILFLTFQAGNIYASNDSCIIKPPHCPSMGYINKENSLVDTCGSIDQIYCNILHFKFEVLAFATAFNSSNIDSVWKDLHDSLKGMKVFFKELARQYGGYSVHTRRPGNINPNDLVIDFDKYQHTKSIETFFESSDSNNIFSYNFHIPVQYIEAFELKLRISLENQRPKLNFFNEFYKSYCELGDTLELEIYRKTLLDSSFILIMNHKIVKSNPDYSTLFQLDTNFIDSVAVINEKYFYYGKVACAPTSNFVSTSGLTSINTNLEGKEYFMISPNPATDFIEIDLTRCAPLAKWSPSVEIKIYNVFGQIQTTPSLRDTHPWKGGEKVKIDVSGLAPGMYFVRIGDRVGKFVKY